MKSLEERLKRLYKIAHSQSPMSREELAKFKTMRFQNEVGRLVG